MIHDIIRNSFDQPDIYMSVDVETAMLGLRKYMFANVYTNPKAKGEEAKAQQLLERLYDYYNQHITQMSEEYIHLIEKTDEPKEKVVCDYIAGMTDQYAISVYEELCIPSSWKVY